MVAESEPLESLYAEWVKELSAQNYEEALDLGMTLYRLLPQAPGRGFSCGSVISPEATLLFDLGNNLVYLSRWEEARFCFVTFLLCTQSEEQIAQTFGPDFSKEEWFRKNRIEEQLFFRETAE